MAATRDAAGSSAGRVRYTPVEGAAELFTPAFLDYLTALGDEFTPRVHALRAARDVVLQRALRQRVLPGPPPSSPITTGSWRVPPVPADLLRPGIEISGPCSITSMFINALNPGPEGERAEGDLDDDEDSAGHRLVDSVRACHNRVAAVNRELAYTDRERGREYRIADGELPFFMHRERGLHLDEPEVTIDGAPIPAAILGTALTLYSPGRAQADRGQGIYFYLPKVESADECAWYRDVFDRSRERLQFLENAVIRGVPLVEALPAVYQMDEMLHALGALHAGMERGVDGEPLGQPLEQRRPAIPVVKRMEVDERRPATRREHAELHGAAPDEDAPLTWAHQRAPPLPAPDGHQRSV